MKKPRYFKGAKKKNPSKKLIVGKLEEKKTSPKAKFPKNSRLIPESHKESPKAFSIYSKKLVALAKHHYLWVQALNVIFLIILLLLGVALFHSLQLLQTTNRQRQSVEKKLHYWEKTVQQYPGFRDAYIQMAILSFSLGEKDQAVSFMRQAKSLDPNSEIVDKVEEVISGKEK